LLKLKFFKNGKWDEIPNFINLQICPVSRPKTNPCRDGAYRGTRQADSFPKQTDIFISKIISMLFNIKTFIKEFKSKQKYRKEKPDIGVSLVMSIYYNLSNNIKANSAWKIAKYN